MFMWLIKGGCGEASGWGTVPVEAGTVCSLRIPAESVILGRYNLSDVDYEA